ncbi:recombinase family protein [Streptomyces sp. NBC_00258]|uniref:recombinase family protein n=1 Tax=Streptomyces sp. NBC_00258 TaxID=2903642 RepID=UPI002E2BF446|nr:recombinase family protein [Streptomyces sp. NBC_00258]
MPIAPEYLHMVYPDTVFHALLYGRNSRDPKKKGRSVADQIGSGRDLCEAHSWPIAEVFDQDVGQSASRHARKKRKDFEALLAAIEAGKGRIVVAWEASRYYRDIEAYIRLRNACMENAVLLCYNGQVYDLSKREDRKATAQDAIAAEDEAEGIRDRVLRTTRSQAKKGMPHGRILWGYARRYDPETGELIEQLPHPERAPVVLDIFQRVAAGETEYTIMKDLQSQGERLPGVKWDYYHLPTMLRNIGYKGRRVFQGEDFGDAVWDGIVPPDLFDAVQRILANEDRSTTRDYSVKHLLSGIARCGNCPDHPHLRVGKARGYLTYGCSAKFDTQMAETKLDAYVEEAVIKWLSSRAAVAAFQSTDQEKRAELARNRQQALEKQLEEARERASTFRPDGTPRLSIASLAELEDRLEPQIQAAKDEAEEMHAPPIVRSLIGSDDVDRRWNNEMTIEQRRAVLRSVVNIRLNKARARGVRTIEPGRIEFTFVGEEGFVRVGSSRRRPGPSPSPAGGTGR